MVERRVALNPLLAGFLGFSRHASLLSLAANPEAVGCATFPAFRACAGSRLCFGV